MSEFAATAIQSLDRFVPAGTIQLYSYNGAEQMTLAQAIMAMTFRRTAQIEAETVIIANLMNANTDKLDKLSTYAQEVLPKGATATVSQATWSKIWDYLVNNCGVASSDIPARSSGLTTHAQMMQAYKAIEGKLKTYNSTSEQLGIELQTQATHRDMFFTMSIDMTAHLGKSGLSSATALKGK